MSLYCKEGAKPVFFYAKRSTFALFVPQHEGVSVGAQC